MKTFALLLTAVLLPSISLAQEHYCPSRTITMRWLQEQGLQVDLAAEAARLEQEGSQRGSVRTVPVVVHVVWNTSAENVSNTVIQNIVARMDADFQAVNTDYGNVRNTFLASRGNPQISFCLATMDPLGNATTGITRTQTSKTWFDPDTETNLMKGATYGKTAWNPNKYLNIWICDISSGASGGYVTAGYAYLPVGGIVGTANDGLVLDYNYGTMDRTASHEIGHYFGLDHPWGDGNCSPGDGISDTPPTNSPTYSCSNTSLMKCNTLTQYENHMDYSNCPVMFTNGQATVMNNVLSGVRASLLTSNGCSGATSGPCVPTSTNGTTDGDYIDGVVLGSINNTNSGSNGGPAYNDYMSLSTALVRGSTYTVSITAGSYAGDHYAAWIDYNGDNTFSASEKLGEFTSTAAGQTGSINFTVPANATLGNSRMRVRGVYHLSSEPTPTDPCFNYGYGETEDYGISITGGSNTPCIPTAQVGTSGGDFIDGVVLQEIQNTGSGSLSAPTYHDYTAVWSATLVRGASYTVEITTGEYGEDLVAAWIDFNGNGQFDTSEKLGDLWTENPFQVVPFTFTVPANATIGNTVMRARVVYPDIDGGQPITPAPCINFVWGETEDYGITITPSVSITEAPGLNLTVRNMGNHVLVTWDQEARQQHAVVLDASGRAVQALDPKGDRLVIGTSTLASGIYQFVLHLDGVRLNTRFLVGGQ